MMSLILNLNTYTINTRFQAATEFHQQSCVVIKVVNT
jgi:hypothetical protein